MQFNKQASILAFCVILILFISCKNKVVKQINGEEITTTTKKQVENNSLVSNSQDISPDSFDEFYQRFHKDSLFQMEHIIFPLEGKPMLADSSQIGKKFYWKKENWKMHRAFDDDSFQRYKDNYEDLVIEKLCDPMGFCLERRFSKIGDNWFLIFYSSMN